jgi:HSP20 family protein
MPLYLERLRGQAFRVCPSLERLAEPASYKNFPWETPSGLLTPATHVPMKESWLARVVFGTRPCKSHLSDSTHFQEIVMRALLSRTPRAHDLFDIRRDVDEVFNRFLNWRSPQEEQSLAQGFVPAVETRIDRDGRKFQCQVMLPGIDPKDVNIQVQGNTLSLSGERSTSRETKDSDYIHREITYGSFQRNIELPEGVDADKVTAEYRNGMLEITAPISTAALPRKIEIKSLPAAKSAGA